MERLRGRWIVRQPSSGTRLRRPGRLQHNACSDPPGASHIPARTGRKPRRRGGRTARRTANRGSSAPHSVRRLRHNQCRYGRNPAEFRRCKHLRNGDTPQRMSGRLRYRHDAFHDGETYLPFYVLMVELASGPSSFAHAAVLAQQQPAVDANLILKEKARKWSVRLLPRHFIQHRPSCLAARNTRSQKAEGICHLSGAERWTHNPFLCYILTA
jgi:hypothetical protein